MRLLYGIVFCLLCVGLYAAELDLWSDGIADSNNTTGANQVYSDGVLVVLGDGDTPDSGYEVPLTDAWFYYSPTNAAQTNTIVDLSGQGNDGASSGSAEFTFIDNSTTEAPHIQGASNAGYDLDGLTNAASDYTIMAWLKTSAEGTLSTIFASDTDDFRVAYGANASEVGFYDGAWKDFGAGQPEDDTWHLLTWEFDASESSAKFYLDDATTPTGTNTYTPRDAGGDVSLLSATDFLGAFYVGEMSSIIGYTGIVSTADRTNFWHNTRTSHGLPAYALNDPQRDSLAVEYPFEYDSAADTSGNENHGTIAGATFSAESGNGIMNGDGVSDYIDLTNTWLYLEQGGFNRPETNAITFAGWFKTDSDTTRQRFFALNGSSSSNMNAGFFWEYTTTTGQVELTTIRAPSVTLYTHTEDGIDATNWNHFAYVGTGVANGYDKYYVNGVLVSSNSYAGEWRPAGTDGQRLMTSRTGGLPLNGAADDFKIWTVGLTDAEINTLYTNSLAAHP